MPPFQFCNNSSFIQFNVDTGQFYNLVLAWPVLVTRIWDSLILKLPRLVASQFLKLFHLTQFISEIGQIWYSLVLKHNSFELSFRIMFWHSLVLKFQSWLSLGLTKFNLTQFSFNLIQSLNSKVLTEFSIDSIILTQVSFDTLKFWHNSLLSQFTFSLLSLFGYKYRGSPLKYLLKTLVFLQNQIYFLVLRIFIFLLF